MTNIATFPNKSASQDDGKHLSGPARCIECRHEWEAVAPVGTYELQCPQCSSMKGIFVWSVDEDGLDRWICHCGADAFMVLRDAIMCYRCGTEQRF